MWAGNPLRGGEMPSTLLWDEVSGCRKGGEGGMGQDCGPSGAEGSSDGLAQGFGALAGFRFGEVAKNPAASSLQHPPVSPPKTTKRQQPGWTRSRHVRSLDLRASRSAVPAYCPLCCCGAAWVVTDETMVASMAN